jgi:hypothetical protein
LELLLVVPGGALFSDLERLRKGPTTDSGKAMVAALDRLAEVSALGFGALSLDAVPQRRVVELARWGMAGKAAALRRHPRARRLATLLATVVYLEAKATDDALELFDVLMVNDLLARAQRQSRAERVRQFPRVARDAARCAAAVAVLLDSEDGVVSLSAIWEAIDAVVPRSDLRAAVANIGALAPPLDADLGGEWRAGLVERYAVVRRFLPRLCATIDFGATAEAVPVLTRSGSSLAWWRPGPPNGCRPATSMSAWWRWRWCRQAGGGSWSFRPIGRKARFIGPRTCSASSSSSISVSGGATSSLPPRPAGPTREPAC